MSSWKEVLDPDSGEEWEVFDFTPRTTIGPGTPLKVLRYRGTERSWRTLWRRRERWETVFAGYMTEGTKIARSMNRPASATFVLEDSFARLMKR